MREGKIYVGAGILRDVLVDGQGRLCEYIVCCADEELFGLIGILRVVVDVPACEGELVKSAGIAECQIGLVEPLPPILIGVAEKPLKEAVTAG